MMASPATPASEEETIRKQDDIIRKHKVDNLSPGVSPSAGLSPAGGASPAGAASQLAGGEKVVVETSSAGSSGEHPGSSSSSSGAGAGGVPTGSGQGDSAGSTAASANTSETSHEDPSTDVGQEDTNGKMLRDSDAFRSMLGLSKKKGKLPLDPANYYHPEGVGSPTSVEGARWDF